MRRDELERMAEGIVRLRSEILRLRAEEGALPPDELTTPQALALRTVVLEGPLRVGGLAAVLGVTVATASRTVDSLEALGLVQRERDPADARAVRVAATAKGRREHANRRERFVRALDRFMDELSEHERRQLADALETVNRLLVGNESALSARRQAG
jgi:DNA-binding MarR family transcriptional regulator